MHEDVGLYDRKVSLEGVQEVNSGTISRPTKKGKSL